MISDCIYYHFLNSLLDGDRKSCSRIVTDLLNNGVSHKDIYLDLIQRAMYRIGQLWENNRISVSNEHLASQITKQLLEIIKTRKNGNVSSGKKALITCIEKEFHDIGAQMIADYLEYNGYEVYFLGANLPVNEIINSIKEINPDLIGISSNFYINIIKLTRLVEEINNRYIGKEILIGGQALLNYDPDILHKYENVHYIPNLKYLDEYLAGKFD